MSDSRVFQASISNLEKMMVWIRATLEQLKIEPNRKKQIELALEEALMNVIQHAYSSPTGIVEVQAEINSKEKWLDFTIIDYGKPFNPLEFQDPELDVALEDRMPGGLGIFFMKKVSDGVEYFRENDSNVLKIRNRI